MSDSERLPYQRVLLKLSGEALAGESGSGIDPHQAAYIARRVSEVYALGLQIAIVIGGGNLWRGGASRPTGHGSQHRRPHGHDRHGDEWLGAARRH